MMTMGLLKPAVCLAAGTPEKLKYLSRASGPPTCSRGLRSDSLEERQGTLGFSPVVLHAVVCMDCRRGGERAGASGPGDGRWGQHRSGNGHLDQVWTESSLTVLHAHVVFGAEAGREAGNLCLTGAVKIRQQDDESKEAGWLHTLQEERNGQPTSSHPT